MHRFLTFLRLLTGVSAAAMVACGGAERPGDTASSPPRPAPMRLPAAATAPASSASRNAAPPRTAEVAVRDPAVLARLDAAGFDLGKLAFGTEAATTTAELASSAGGKSVFAVVESDVRAAARAHPHARVTSIDGFRLFETRWLRSDEMRFELSGVFSRLDRRAFYPSTCGEMRFLYRLAYRTTQGGQPMASRLPMTMNVLFLVNGGADCREAARRHQPPPDTSPAERAAWLVSDGALSAQAQRDWTLKSVEVNLQSLRLQSSVRPALAGHIEYVMRVFHPSGKGGAFEPAPMENMPDVPRLSRDAGLRAELLAHLMKPETLRDVDTGILVLPERFLAKQATSVAPRGLSRLANRPFRALFATAELQPLDLSGYRTIRSPDALLRRLDGATCVGCHQSRSIAGFHHVGQDAAEHPSWNSLVSGSSPHLDSDLERRRTYVDALARGETPDEQRPIPERQGTGNDFGAPCGLGDPGFQDWKCAEGLRCTALEDSVVGVCLGETEVGSPCEHGSSVTGTHARPDRDAVPGGAKVACAEHATCDTNFQGFPLGACGTSCRGKDASVACADFLDVDGFQNCLRGKLSLDACASKYVFGTGVRSCDAQHPCRQDYVCARGKNGQGACVPPYFVYQLRLDGYPILR